MKDIKSSLEYLLTNNFVVEHKGKFKFTNVFYKEYKSVDMGLTVNLTVNEPALSKLGMEVFVPKNTDLATYKYTDWVKMYEHFIIEAQVPPRLLGSNGEAYSGNKFSEDGLKAFQKAIKENYKYDILRSAIMLYYKSTTKFKKAIGTYMSSGEWRTDYATLLEVAILGKDEMQKHITKETQIYDPYSRA